MNYFRLMLTCSFLLFGCEAKSRPDIAVIGGGIGGATAVHYLEEFFGPGKAFIDVFESHNIGGRLSTMKVLGQDYELGGSVIHERNRLMIQFMKLLGFEKKECPVSKYALYDGKEVVFTSESNWSMINMMKLMARYGMGPLFLSRLINNMLDKFDRVYSFHDDGKAYSTVIGLLTDMNPDFVKYLGQSSKVGFQESGINKATINEIILAMLSANYGQTLDVQQFVGSVSSAGVVGDMFSVKGGNYRVPERLLEKSDAKLLKAHVVNISREEDRTYKIYYTDENSVDWFKYDIVIIATPLAENVNSKLKLLNFPESFYFPGHYHETWCTFVAGTLNRTYLGISEDITDIFSLDDSHFFNAIGEVYPVDGERSVDSPPVWKLFSHEKLKNEKLKLLFSDWKEVRTKKWLAYPHYTTTLMPDRFELFRNLYHVNAIEWAASAMEMSAIGARNVALLAFQKWTGKIGLPKTKVVKEEL